MPDRRAFLSQAAALVAAPSVVLGGGSVILSDAGAILGDGSVIPGNRGVILSEAKDLGPARHGAAASAAWDLSWIDKLATGKHKAVFDATMITNGLASNNVDVYLRDYKELYNVDERDMRAVLVFRHEAIPMILNDAFWSKYQIGKTLQLVDPITRATTMRNYFGITGPRPAPDLTTLEQLSSRGVILLGCNRALMSVSSIIAQQARANVEAVQAEARASVLPFVTLMPSGIFAATRAQEAGCQYVRAT
jgi:hypothetical protein